VQSIPPLFLALALAAPLCAMACASTQTVPLRVEAVANPGGASGILVIDGLAGLPKNGGIIEVKAHARGIAAAGGVLTRFTVLSSKTTSWRVPVDAPPAFLDAITADPNARVSITACDRSDATRCSVIGARSVTLRRNTRS
jgi:hypothetical protein